MAPVNNEGEIAFNKVNIALARSQRQIASWLPPPTPSEATSTKLEAEIDKEEAELFQPVPELAGLGAPLPKEIADGSANRQELSSNDKLRKQLFGGKIASRTKSGVRPEIVEGGHSRHRPVTKAPRPAVAIRGVVEEDEDEEASRSSLGRSKRKRNSETTMDASGGDDDTVSAPQMPSTAEEQVRQLTGSSKRSTSILDEILAERSFKRRKKKKKRQPKSKNVEIQ